MRKTPFSISLVLPGYNEEANIDACVRNCRRQLAQFTDRFEIILVNDGSTDRTAALADRLAKDHAEIRVLHNPLNFGVGISLLLGFKAARGDLVFHNALDNPFDLADLEKVLPLFPENDLVVVVRKDRSAHSPYRRLTSLVNFWLIRLLFRIGLRDLNFIQVYKREVLQSVVRAKSPAFVTPEILIRAHDRGYKIAEVEAVFHRRNKGKANYGKARDILWTLADMVSLRLEKWRKAA